MISLGYDLAITIIGGAQRRTVWVYLDALIAGVRAADDIDPTVDGVQDPARAVGCHIIAVSYTHLEVDSAAEDATVEEAAPPQAVRAIAAAAAPQTVINLSLIHI